MPIEALQHVVLLCWCDSSNSHYRFLRYIIWNMAGEVRGHYNGLEFDSAPKSQVLQDQ